MASIHKERTIEADPEVVWDALRDWGALHERLVPGFVVDAKLDGDDRIVTFFNGLVARERLITIDDEACRLVYAVVEGRPSHYNAAVQVFPVGDGSRVVWTIDLLPNDLAPAVGGMMDHAAGFMKKTLEAA